MTYLWKDPSLSLGERCIAFIENRRNKDRLNFNLEEFSICSKNINGKEISVGSFHNYNAAVVSLALYNSLLLGEIAPHWFRQSVDEIEIDLLLNDKYRLSNTKYKPKKGDIAFFYTPDTMLRNIGFVNSCNSIINTNVNSRNINMILVDVNSNMNNVSMLGFGEYPKN